MVRSQLCFQDQGMSFCVTQRRKADYQAEIERVEKLVAKMEKKNKGGDEDVNEDAIADAEEGGAKEPDHSK